MSATDENKRLSHNHLTPIAHRLSRPERVIDNGWWPGFLRSHTKDLVGFTTVMPVVLSASPKRCFLRGAEGSKARSTQPQFSARLAAVGHRPADFHLGSILFQLIPFVVQFASTGGG